MGDTIMTEFKCHLNCTAVGEHVPEAERAIRIIKERARCIVSSWVYKNAPITFKTSLIKFVVFWLNSIPHNDSIIPNICSKAIVVGTYPDYNKHCKLAFGSYTHVHNTRTITNTMASRTSPAIALGPVSNLQGSYRFFCLETKRIVIRRQFTELPLPKSVIYQINKLP